MRTLLPFRSSPTLLLAAACLTALPLSLASAQTQPESKEPAPKQPTREEPRDSSRNRSGKVDLRPKFKKGEKHTFRMVLDSTTRDEASKNKSADKSSQTMRQEMVLSLKTVDVTETGAVADLTYESIKMKGETGPLKVDFDSTKKADPEDPIDSVMRGVVGLTLRLNFDQDGNISSVNPVEGGGSTPGMPDITSMLSGAGGGGMGGSFGGADIIKGMFGPIVAPSKGNNQVSVGESWTNETQMNGGLGGFGITTKNTLTSVSNGKATIDMKGGAKLAGKTGKDANKQDKSKKPATKPNSKPNSKTDPKADPNPAGDPLSDIDTLPTGGLPGVSIKNSELTGKTIWNLEKGTIDSMTSTQRFLIETGTGEDTTLKTSEMNVKVDRINK